MEHVSFVEGRGNLMITYTPEGASGEYTSNTLKCKGFLAQFGAV